MKSNSAPTPLKKTASWFNCKGNAKVNNHKPELVLAASNHRCCAERRLLQNWVEAAKRHGVAAHRITTWVRRKLGPDILVVRHRSDGSLGCAAPCLLCQRELRRFDLRVHCSLAGGSFFSGRLTDSGAPAPILTSGQRRMLKKDFE